MEHMIQTKKEGINTSQLERMKALIVRLTEASRAY